MNTAMLLEVSVHLKLIDLVEKNFDKIHWSRLSHNKNAINLLKLNTKKIVWKKYKQFIIKA